MRKAAVYVGCPDGLTGSGALVVGAVAEALERRGLAVRLGADRPARTDVCGAIFMHPPGPVRVRVRRRHPLVLVGSEPLPDGVAGVWADRAAGTRALVTHLRALGHRRIGLVGSAGAAAALGLEPPLGRPGDDGLRSASAPGAFGLEPQFTALGVEPELGRPGDDGFREAGELLDLERPPTALVCGSEALAAGALHAARVRGLRVPLDLSVAGFDDSGLAGCIQPDLTVARMPWGELGRAAGELLLRLLDGHRAEPSRVAVPMPLMVRNSTGRALSFRDLDGIVVGNC